MQIPCELQLLLPLQRQLKEDMHRQRYSLFTGSLFLITLCIHRDVVSYHLRPRSANSLSTAPDKT